MTADAIRTLTERLSSWSDAAAELARAAADRSGWSPGGAPALVVRPADVAEVQATVRHAASHGIPIVTRGRGSGLAGGASAGAGAIVLDLSGLDRIVEIRPEDQLAVVEPGVVTAELDAAARRHGLFYAPDPGSVGISSIGGNIATNAGGLRGAKYGVTRDAVLALDVVLADGTLLHVGRETAKGVAGYDLAGLFVGSEGTLGIVVRATLRLLPVPEGSAVVAAYFESIEAAAQAVVSIGDAGLRPAVLEIVDGATLRAIDDAVGTELHSRGEAFLLAQTDGLGAALEAARLEEVLGRTATSVEATADPDRAAALLAARRQALPAIERLGRVLIEDVAVPRSRLAETIRTVQRIGRDTGVRIFVFAHAGDGNVHPIILLEGVGDADPIPPEAERAVDEIFAAALAAGGTVTGEHGVGALKRRWLAEELGEAHVWHRRVKSLFDPLGILNPGKAL